VSVWRRLFRVGKLPDVAGAGRPNGDVARAQQRQADDRVDEQRAKLNEAKRDVPAAYRQVDSLGQEVTRALRALRGHP